MALCGLWPGFEGPYTEQLIFELTYVQHGGSGMTWTRHDVLNMDFVEATASVKRLGERRAEEARAIRAAGRKK